LTNTRRDCRAGCGRQLAQRDPLWNASGRLHRNDDFEATLVVGQRVEESAGSFACDQPRLRQQLAHGASFRAKLLEEVIAARHEWPHGNRGSRARALDDLRHFGSGRLAQLHERGVKRTLLTCVPLVDLLRELREQSFCAPAVFR
jgi:hypothetical protein